MFVCLFIYNCVTIDPYDLQMDATSRRYCCILSFIQNVNCLFGARWVAEQRRNRLSCVKRECMRTCACSWRADLDNGLLVGFRPSHDTIRETNRHTHFFVLCLATASTYFNLKLSKQYKRYSRLYTNTIRSLKSR